MKLIVGLGNPESKYVGTRHNLGFEAVDKYITHALPVEESDKFWSLSKNLKAEIGKLNDLIFAKPQTYMNLSGQSVKALADYYKIEPEDIIIVHDELDLPLGHLKIRLGGAAAGHHGVESIINTLGTDKFVRVRLGIGNLKSKTEQSEGPVQAIDKYVLGQFADGEKSDVRHLIKKAIKALETLLEDGLETAQNQYN